MDCGSAPRLAVELKEKVLQGDLRALARAATLVENQTPEGHELMRQLFSHTGDALTLGITGPPGAGKSTLVNQLTKIFRKADKTVGILAVDPTSPFTGGAILGDRIRMQDHFHDPGVFIRSLATRGRLGGLAQATLDLCLLLDAAGWDVILVETLGVGQDEVEIARLADVTVVVLVPGFGDDVQAIKAGIMEIADIFAINKADLPGADKLEREVKMMQSFAASQPDSAAPVLKMVANEGTGIDALISAAEEVFRIKGRSSARQEIWQYRLREMLREQLLKQISEDKVTELAAKVATRTIDPYSAVDALAREALLS